MLGPQGAQTPNLIPRCPNPAGVGPFCSKPCRAVPQHLLVPSCPLQEMSQVAQPLQAVAAPLPQRGPGASAAPTPRFQGWCWMWSTPRLIPFPSVERGGFAEARVTSPSWDAFQQLQRLFQAAELFPCTQPSAIPRKTS